jgi:hypothetical protein
VKYKPEQEVLKGVIPRIIQPSSTDTAQLGLEITDGPYKGVTYGYTRFEVQNGNTEDGMVPVKFETTIYSAPEGFTKDETFDAFTSEVLLAWLEYIAGDAPKGD